MSDRFAPLEVTLDPTDMRRVNAVALSRVRQSRAGGLNPHTHGFNGDPIEIDLPGAAGECAFCKALGLTWGELVGTFKLPDVGWNIQIRTAPCKAFRPPPGFGTLIVRPDDDPRDRFALVAGHIPHFVLLGWATGRLLRNDQWLKAEAGRPPAWFIPNEVLDKNLDDLLR